MLRETYKLRDWIDPNKIIWPYLSANRHPQAIAMLEQHPDNIDWFELTTNSSAIHLLEKNLDKTNRNQLLQNISAMCIMEKNKDKLDYWGYFCRRANDRQIRIIEDHLDEVDEVIDLVKNVNKIRATSTPVGIPMYIPTSNVNWKELSTNRYAVHILEKNVDKIDWFFLSRNSSSRALHLLETHPDQICWKQLCLNANELTRRLLEKYPDEIHWKYLSMNNTSWAIAFLKQYPDKIHWEKLSGNPHPQAIALLEKHPEKISWLHLSGNIHPRAAHLLAQHPERIAWGLFSRNPQLFVWNEEYDYETMKQHKQPLHQELIQAVFHPKNLSKFEYWGFECGFDPTYT